MKHFLEFALVSLGGALLGMAIMDAIWKRSARPRDGGGKIVEVPLPGDHRWAPVQAQCGHSECMANTWLAAGDAVISDGPDRFTLLIGEHVATEWEGAQRYVEAVHAAWRARRAPIN